MKMQVLDLFSGIGGFSLGLERAGMETVAFCEVEKYPVSILNKHWPDVPVHNDVRKLDGKQYRGAVDVVCGGFPCQPFSVAGKQRGKNDNRHLWPEMLRIIRESKPTWVIGENVAGFVKMALDDVSTDLENEGYSVQSFIIPATGVGANHRRSRVWIVAYSKHNGLHAAKVRGGIDSSGNHDQKRPDETVKSAGGCQSACRGNLCHDKQGSCTDTELQGLQGHAWNEQNSGKRTDEARPITQTDFSRDWEPIGKLTQPTVCHRNDGVPDRVARLKALGNAVVPQIPEMIGRAIIEAHDKHDPDFQK